MLLSTIGECKHVQCHFPSVASVLWHVSLSGECQPSLSLTLTESPLKGDDNQLDQSFSDSSLFNHWGQDLGPESRRVALKMFQYYGYNGYLSDRLSMDRPIPDYRPEGWVSDSLSVLYLLSQRMPVWTNVIAEHKSMFGSQQMTCVHFSLKYDGNITVFWYIHISFSRRMQTRAVRKWFQFI